MTTENNGQATPPSPRVGRLDTASAVLREMSKVYRAARSGKLDVAEACRFTYMLQTMGRLWETTEFERRLEALERNPGEKR
jgi:hypothetical protein